MKFSDIDETLNEAPEDFAAKQGLGKRIAAKAQKKLGPTKNIRRRGAAKDNTLQLARNIKSEFKEWGAEVNAGTSLEEFKEFLGQRYPDYASYVDDVAIRLKFSEPKQAVAPEDEKADEVSGEEQEDMISPEEQSGAAKKDSKPEKAKEPLDPTKKPEGMDQEEYDSIKAAYAKRATDDQEESVEENSDDAEPKVDMSASIYESRLNYFLLLERDLKDNQLDTLITRLVQVAKRKGVMPKEPEQKAEPKQKAEPEQQAEPESKEDGWRQKISKALTGAGNVGDIGKGDGASSLGKVASEDGSMIIGANEYEPLTNLLNKIQKSTKPLDPKDRKLAGQLLNKIQHANSE